ncbi:MAG TPA: MFS transporter [Gaiellaceae bacterium]|nr:MFS transporter [Gaiellaceae bacterium]
MDTTTELMPVKRSAVSALVLAETISVLGTRMTYLALPWFVLVTTGSPGKMSLVLAAEILPMAIFGIPSGAVVQRLGSRTTMLVADFARAPILMSIPLLYSAGVLSFGLLLAIVALLGAFAPPYFASQRTILPELVGEDETRMSQANSSLEGGNALAALVGPALAGALIPFIGAPNVLYVDAATYLVAFFLVLVFVPRRKPVTSAVQHGILAGLRFVLADRLLAPLAATMVVFGFLAAGMSAGLPVYAYDEFDGSSWIAGLFYAALGAGAVVGSVFAVLAVRRMPPLRLAALGILAFSVPLWVLPFLPPWPVVFGALFLATFFTPLVNGPLIAVLTARTPEGLRAKVMTAVISVNTLAAPVGFLVAGQVLEHWGVVPLFTAVVAGITWMAVVFAAITWRHADGEPEPTAELAAT